MKLKSGATKLKSGALETLIGALETLIVPGMKLKLLGWPITAGLKYSLGPGDLDWSPGDLEFALTGGAPIKVSPHGFNLVWIDELFPNLNAILDNSPATVLVTCCDCDINGHMITLRGNDAVALQHMWGY